MADGHDFDFVIIGSGFGGSVSALRLAEKGFRVCVLEKGKRFRDQDFAKTNWDLRRYLWLPLLKCFGIQNISLFKNVMVLSGTGVGGGSLVYANTLLVPGKEFFNAPAWKGLADWEAELLPCYDTAKKMLGVATNPVLTFADDQLREIAHDMGRGDTFKPAQVGVFFGTPNKTVPDPYFGGKGPERAGCEFCGGCMVGCRHNAKNTLVKNYLYLAEKLGVEIRPEREVVDVRPLSEDGSAGYEVRTVRSTSWVLKAAQTLRAKRVVFAGGVLGTVRLLLKLKRTSLPRLSDRLGFDVRTNSEALIGISEPGAPASHDYARGVAISSIFHPDDHTHIEPVRYPSGSSFMRVLAAPMVDGRTDRYRDWLRPLKMLWAMVSQPLATFRVLLNWDWANTTIILLVMQTVDNKLRMRLGRGLFTAFRRDVVTELEPGTTPTPTYIPVGNEVGRRFAAKVGGVPQSAINEVVLNIPSTAHILGGCGIGRDPASGVIDAEQRVFGYEGLWVCDGSAIPANLGVNPSLTITAMTERAMKKV